ncbi:hypothetical protein MMC18_007761 [Xylographa bjoerkii]|nr:hypothetical protein [Xylographa bjoerkii]
MAQNNIPAFFSLMHSQLFVTMPVPMQSFSGQTVIVTGSNAGLGKEAANHIVRLGAEKVILAVRTISKGETAKKYIEQKTGRKGVIEVWSLDLSSYASVKAFVKRAETLERLDAVLENAGVLTETFSLAEGNESSITVNVISTLLLALLILPKLQETATKFNVRPCLSLVGSDIHNYSLLPAKKYPNILGAMNDMSKTDMAHRYTDSKLIQILYFRELAARMSQSTKPAVTLNTLSPGFCHSELFGEQQANFGFNISRRMLARSTEEGSRALVAAVVQGNQETHGEYMMDAKIAPVSRFARSKEGKLIGERLRFPRIVFPRVTELRNKLQPRDGMIFPNRLTAKLTGHGGPVHCVTFSAGAGQYVLTGSSDRTIRLYNPLKAAPSALATPPTSSTSKPTIPAAAAPGLIQTYSAHGYEVLDLAVTADNARFASVGGDRQVFLWDVSTGRTLRRWAGHGGRVNAVALGGAAQEVVVSGSFDATVRLWDGRSAATKPIQVLEDARDSVSSVAVAGWEIVAGSVDGRVRLYDVRMGVVHVDVVGHPVTSVCPTGDGAAVLVSTLDSTLRLMDRANGQLLQAYRAHSNTEYRVRSCLGLNDAVVVSGSEDGYLYAWDLLEGKVVEKMRAHEGKVASAVAWNGKGREWASAGGDGEFFY